MDDTTVIKTGSKYMIISTVLLYIAYILSNNLIPFAYDAENRIASGSMLFASIIAFNVCTIIFASNKKPKGFRIIELLVLLGCASLAITLVGQIIKHTQNFINPGRVEFIQVHNTIKKCINLDKPSKDTNIYKIQFLNHAGETITTEFPPNSRANEIELLSTKFK